MAVLARAALALIIMLPCASARAGDLFRARPSLQAGW